MREQDQAQSVLGAIDFSDDSRAASELHAARRSRCANCGGPFGLVRRRRGGKQFCSGKCAEQYADGLRQALEAKTHWYERLYRRR